MYEKLGSHTQVIVQHLNDQTRPYGEGLYGAGSDVIKAELGAYGEKLLGSGSTYLQTNLITRKISCQSPFSGGDNSFLLITFYSYFDITTLVYATIFLAELDLLIDIRRYFSNPRYYFQVNDEYVKNKLKVILFPFLHRGHWMRTSETIGGEFSYLPPIFDINAPDLYIPLMAFGTYVVLAGFFLGVNARFSPEALCVQFTNGLLCWVFQVLLLETSLHTLGDGDIPLLDVVAYGGYTFAAVSVALLARILWSYCFYVVTTWECFCMGMFFVKTIKRILIAEVRSCEKHSSKRHYVLLLVAVAQFPLLFWLVNIGV